MKKLLLFILSTLLIGCTGVATNQNVVEASIDSLSNPQSGSNIIIIKHTYYTNYFDTLYKSEVMGKYIQTVQNSLADVDTSRNRDRKLVASFKEDPLIPERFETATNSFYSNYNRLHKLDGQRVDKGHVNPYSAFSFNLIAAKESMYIQNTCPQSSRFNEHQWEAVEQHVIKQVSLIYDSSSSSYKPNQDSITVYTGVLIKDKTISDDKGNKLYIPDYYWKVISYNKDGKFIYEAWLGKNSFDNLDTNPDDIKVNISDVKKAILSYYPNFKLEF